MDKTPNDKSIWQQSKGVFNDGTEIISETFEAGETVEVLADVVKINSIIDA